MHVWKINFQMEREGKIVEISVKYSFNLIITAFTLSCQCQKILIAFFFFLRTTTLKDSRGIKECPISVQLSGGGVCKFMIHTVTSCWTVREMSLQLGVEIYVSDTADCVFDWISEDQDILIVFVWVKNTKSEEKPIWVYMTSLI